MKTYEVDPITPFIYPEAEILILGTFPAPVARQTGFYYANPSNYFWRVLASVFEEETPESIEDRKAFLKRHKIALWNVCHACLIDGAKDSSISQVEPNDIAGSIKETNIKTIFTSGKLAGKLYRKYCYEDAKLEDIYLPSTSAANRPNYSFDAMVEAHKQILEYL